MAAICSKVPGHRGDQLLREVQREAFSRAPVAPSLA